MNKIVIAVFKKDWIDASILFEMLRVFNVSIEGQDCYGDRVNEIKNTHLIVDGSTARWADADQCKEFILQEGAKDQFVATMHYDSLIYQIKN